MPRYLIIQGIFVGLCLFVLCHMYREIRSRWLRTWPIGILIGTNFLVLAILLVLGAVAVDLLLARCAAPQRESCKYFGDLLLVCVSISWLVDAIRHRKIR